MNIQRFKEFLIFKQLTLAVLTLFLILFQNPGFSAQILVPGDHITIQGAIDAANGGDEIIVSQGTYIENIQFKGKNIILRSTEPTNPLIVDQTIIDGNQAGSVVTFGGTENASCVLNGLTITNGGGNYGAGLCGNGNRATINNNNIINNVNGGGIRDCYGLIINNIISGNILSNGNGGGIRGGTGILRNNIISGNQAEGGGGISNFYGKIDNNIIEKNVAFQQMGGGLYYCTGVIQNNIIRYNYSIKYGGGLFNCNGIIRNNIIIGNESEDDGGGIAQCEGTIENNKIQDNKSYWEGGGLYLCNGVIKNNLILNNIATIGSGLAECDGSILNNTIYGNMAFAGSAMAGCNDTIFDCIIWDNPSYSGEDIYICSMPSYSCIDNILILGTNISDNPMFIDPDNEDFHLQPASPCIDSGDPNPGYNDGCLPPGMGTERNDMGAYGGTNNCSWLLETLSGAIADITEYRDVWAANNSGAPPFDSPSRRGWIGFRFEPENGWYPLKGNANASGLDDLIQITEYGDAWVAPSSETEYGPATRWAWLGFKYVETTYNGWLPLSGDVDGTGSDDLIQVTQYGDAWVAISMETMYNPPTRWGWLGYRFNRGIPGENGAIPLSGDANGDGKCDLIQVTEYTDAWVAISTETMYNPPTRWGWLGFKYAPFDGWYPLCGDVNADGADDLIQITPTGDPWVSLSTESAYSPPTRWGWLNFYYDEAQGYYPLTGDVNADGMIDLIQITPSGEALVAPSTGTSFDYPEHWGWLGFKFDRDLGYLPFYMDY